MHRIKKSRERRLGRGQRDREILLKEKDRTRMTLTDRCARLRVRVPRRTTLNRTYVTATPLSVPSCPFLTPRTGKMGGSAWEGAGALSLNILSWRDSDRPIGNRGWASRYAKIDLRKLRWKLRVRRGRRRLGGRGVLRVSWAHGWQIWHG
ncbi:hypothetical protein CALVIDRAFT_405395 [Calocera viscosa TUFC12733]|uniref:Uncharacterized protein n=1 Tax=Calocera viscosa (strain TUFC12733) TaxID=1330018 RepID=A0A167PWX2_CALVF|nr:hypothetical protein CALVIDRAFT_405395 [Calocera viscosa TUFC12733]